MSKKGNKLGGAEILANLQRNAATLAAARQSSQQCGSDMQLDFGQIIPEYNDEEAIHDNDKIKEKESNQNLESEMKTILEAQSKQLTIQKKLKYLSRLRVSFRELSRMSNNLNNVAPNSGVEVVEGIVNSLQESVVQQYSVSPSSQPLPTSCMDVGFVTDCVRSLASLLISYWNNYLGSTENIHDIIQFAASSTRSNDNVITTDATKQKNSFVQGHHIINCILSVGPLLLDIMKKNPVNIVSKAISSYTQQIDAFIEKSYDTTSDAAVTEINNLKQAQPKLVSEFFSNLQEHIQRVWTVHAVLFDETTKIQDKTKRYNSVIEFLLHCEKPLSKATFLQRDLYVTKLPAEIPDQCNTAFVKTITNTVSTVFSKYLKKLPGAQPASVEVLKHALKDLSSSCFFYGNCIGILLLSYQIHLQKPATKKEELPLYIEWISNAIKKQTELHPLMLHVISVIHYSCADPQIIQQYASTTIWQDPTRSIFHLISLFNNLSLLCILSSDVSFSSKFAKVTKSSIAQVLEDFWSAILKESQSPANKSASKQFVSFLTTDSQNEVLSPFSSTNFLHCQSVEITQAHLPQLVPKIKALTTATTSKQQKTMDI